MVDIQTISLVITAMSVTVGIVISVNQFRNLVKTRQAQFYLDLYNKLMEKELHRYLNEILLLWTWENPNDFFEKYGAETNFDEWLKFTSVTTVLENMGLILHENLVDVHFVANLIGSMIQNFWEKYEPILIEFKQRYNTPKIMPMTEYLVNQVKQVRPR